MAVWNFLFENSVERTRKASLVMERGRPTGNQCSSLGKETNDHFLTKLFSRTEPEPVRENNFVKKSRWRRESKNAYCARTLLRVDRMSSFLIVSEQNRPAKQKQSKSARGPEQKHLNKHRPRLFLTWCLPRVRPKR